MDASPRLIDLSEKQAARRAAAPLTSDLLARKGEAVSAAREVLNAHGAAAPPREDMVANPEARPRVDEVLSKRWIAVAAVLLIGGSVAVGYLSRPAIERSADAETRPAGNSAPARAASPPAAISATSRPGDEKIAVASGPQQAAAPETVATPSDIAKAVAIAPAAGNTAQEETVTAVPKPPKPLPPIPAPPAAKPPVVKALIEKPMLPATPTAAAEATSRPKLAPPPAPKTVSKPAVEPPPAPKKTVLAVRTSPPAAAPVAKPPYVVQLASLKSNAAASREWARLKIRYAALFEALEPSIQRATIPKRGTFYRLRADGFATRRQAVATCAKLKAAGQGCLVVKR